MTNFAVTDCFKNLATAGFLIFPDYNSTQQFALKK